MLVPKSICLSTLAVGKIAAKPYLQHPEHTNWKNGGMDAKRMSKAAFETITKSVGKSAGIKQKCTVHVLRKTFATRLADRGCPLEVIQELLGHADPGTTSKNYVAKSKNRVKRACEQYLFAA